MKMEVHLIQIIVLRTTFENIEGNEVKLEAIFGGPPS